jgi:hypothetical protein
MLTLSWRKELGMKMSVITKVPVRVSEVKVQLMAIGNVTA